MHSPRLSLVLALGSAFAGMAHAQSQLSVGPGQAYATIQAAIAAAVAGSTIVVAPGTYNENLSINKSLTLVGPNDTIAALPESGWVRGPEAIVGSSAGGTRVVISGAVTVNIRGFKFRGPSTGDAMGMNIQAGTRGVISNNWFDNLTQTSTFGGADIYTTAACGPWEFRGNRHDNRGFRRSSGDADEGTFNYSAINAWYINNATIHGNRIEGYGAAGIQLESTARAQVTSNYIKDVGTNGIQVANGAANGALIQGNTIDGASRAYQHSFGDDPIDPEYGWGGIRVWQVATSGAGLTEVRNNRILNTPARVGGLTFVGSNANRQTVAAISGNAFDASNTEGMLHLKAAVRAVSITGGVATLDLWEGSSTVANAIGRTNHAAGQTVVVSGLGAPYDGTHVLSAVGGVASTDYFGWAWAYKTISFALAGQADVPHTLVQTGAAASMNDAAASVPAEGNWWGAASGPSGATAAKSSAGATADTNPWILSYTAGSAPVGFIDGVGFWPTNVVLSNSDADADGLSAAEEVLVHGTNPDVADTDGDGLSDGIEVLTHETNPLSGDTDGDTFGDLWEITSSYDPLDMDSPIPFGNSLEESLAAYLQDFGANVIGSLPLTVSQANGINALWQTNNVNAAKGRRTSLSNRLFAASKYALNGDYTAAITEVQGALSKTAPVTAEKTTWLVDQQTYSDLVALLNILIQARGY